MLTSLKPIEIIPARERVVSAVRKAILSQELQTNEILTVKSISEKLGVSITPVREAFQTLAREGLLELRPNKGAIVLGVNEKNVRDHYEARAIIESEIVRRICRNGADLSQLKRICDEMDESLRLNQFEKNYSCDHMYHYEIWKLGNNDKLKAIAGDLWNTLSPKQKDAERYHAQIQRSTKQHKDILVALAARDEEGSSELMKQHILQCMGDVLRSL